MGRGRGTRRLWIAGLPETIKAIARYLVEVTKMNQRSVYNIRTEVLHWDGRLDNRDDLLLQLRDSLRGDTSNQGIARAVYERWGSEGLVHLIGDWSLVIRD